MLVDATLKHPMSPLALPAREYMERAQAIWKELVCRAYDSSAVHGYSLGDWNATWDQFARNAVAGEWEKNGANTVARRRGGLTPRLP